MKSNIFRTLVLEYFSTEPPRPVSVRELARLGEVSLVDLYSLMHHNQHLFVNVADVDYTNHYVVPSGIAMSTWQKYIR